MDNDPQGRAEVRRQTAVACLIAAVAAVATRWLESAALVVLSVIALSAVLLMLLALHSRARSVVVVAVAVAIAVRLPGIAAASAAESIVIGLLTALVLTAPLMIRRAVQERREFRRRGWRLAAEESRRRTSETRSAVQEERTRLAAEMHDGLGHSLTLIAVRLGQLSLTPTLSDENRAEVTAIRGKTADAAEELGRAVAMLRQPDDNASSWQDPSIERAVERARDAGMRVVAHVDDKLTGASEEVVRTVSRAVQEGLTNAAKHASGQPVAIDVDVRDETLRMTMSNPLPGSGGMSTVAESGFGLQGVEASGGDP